MSSSTTKHKPKPRSSVASSVSSSVPDAVDPKLMELARQIGLSRFNALVQSRARSTSTSTPTAPPLNPAPVPSATSLATPESSRSKAAKAPAERTSTSKRKSVNSMALPVVVPVVETPPSKKGKSTSKHGQHQIDEDANGKANDAPTNDDEEERKARKKQRKLDRKEAKRKAALEAQVDMELDELASPVKDSKKKKRKKEQEGMDKEAKKRSKKSKKLDKGKGKEIVQDNLDESFSSAANHHPSPPPKPIAEAISKSKSSSKRPRPSELDSKVAVSPVKTPRKKRKLANGSSAAVPSTQANAAVSAPARPAVNGLPSTSTNSRDLEQLLVQTVNVLRASPSYAHESGVFGEGIVQLFQALVAKVASADMRPEAPLASNHDDDDSTTPQEDEHEYEQHCRLSQNSGRAPLNGIEAPAASTSTSSSTRPALASTFVARPTATPTADVPETQAEAAIKARSAKAAKKLLKKERREKKQQKEIGAEPPSSPPEEQEVVSSAPDEEDGPATPLSSPDKSERMNKERPIRKRLGKLEKGALRSMSQSAGSSRQSSLAPTLTLSPAREEIVIKVLDSQAEEAERAAIHAAKATIESSASSPDEDGPLNHSTNPTIRFRGEDDEASENEIDQLASTPVLARPSDPLRQAPRSTTAFSSEDDPEEIELSLRTHASPRKDRPLSLDPEVESGDESEPRTEDDGVEENHKEADGHARESLNDGSKEQHENRGEGDDEPPTRPMIEHDADAAMADAQAQDESHVEEDAVRRASPITNGVVPSPGQRQPVDPVNVPLPPSPSPPPPIRTIGHDDSDASSSSDDDGSDSSSSSTASNRAYRKPSRPSIGAVATSAFGSAASMRRNRAKRQSSPLKTSSLARTLSSTGPEVDKDAEMEEDVDELLSQPVPKSVVQKLLQDAEEEEQRLEDPRGRLTSVSSSEADTNTAGAVAEPSKEGAVEEQRNGGGEGDAGCTQSLKEVNSSLEATTAEPMEAVNLSDIAAQASSAPGTPLMMNTQASQLVRIDHRGVDSDESQYVPLIKSQPFSLEATQQTQRLPGFVDHESEESQTSSQTILNGSSQVKKAVDAATLDVPSQATSNGRLTRAASLRARTASPGPPATASSASAPSFKNSDSARPPSASQPLPTTSFRGHGRASSMRALSQLDEATPRRSMRHVGPSTSQGSTSSARGAAVPALSWIRKGDDGENDSEDDSSEDEDCMANGTSTRPRKSKVLWN